jgi:hypothetical protein
MFLVCAALAFWGCARYDDVVIPLGQGNGGAYAGGGSGPVIQTNIVITGGYLSAGISEPPVRVFFTDGGAADGYIDTKTGIVMLYDDQWNDGKSGGKIFHTLRIISSGSDILLSREFYTNPATDPVELVINDQGGLEFHPYIPNPNDGYKGYIPISTVGELALIGRDVGTQCGAYRLTRDLDLLGSPVSVSGNVLTPRPHNWVPIELAGAFDGEGRRLENLYINRQADTHQGLFGIVSGTVKNTRVSGSVAGYRFIGGVAGEVGNGGRIEGCSFDGAVVGYSRAGGVVGENYGTITACYNTGAVTSPGSNKGGVLGSLGSGTITSCYWLTLSGGGASQGNGSIANDPDAKPFSSSDWPSFTTDWLAYTWTSSGDETNGKYWKSIGRWSAPPDDGSQSEFPKLYWQP